MSESAELPGPPEDREGKRPSPSRPEASEAVWTYLRATHERMLRALERAEDRPEARLVVRSAEALNRSFRRFQETQERLAEELRAERRRSRRGLLAVWSIGVLFAAVLLWIGREWVRSVQEGQERIVEAAARTLVKQEETAARTAASQERVVEAVDRGLEANRALVRENRSLLAQVEQLRAQLRRLEEERGQLEATLEAERRRRAGLEAELGRARKEADRWREQWVRLQALGAAVETRRTGSGESGAQDAAPPAAEGEPVESHEDEAGPSPLAASVNRLLDDCGVADLRLIDLEGGEAGWLLAPVFEVRSSSGVPIGFERADRARFRLRQGSFALVLEGGVSIRRGVRSPIPEEGYEIRLPAPPPEGSWPDELAPYVAIEDGGMEGDADDPPASAEGARVRPEAAEDVPSPDLGALLAALRPADGSSLRLNAASVAPWGLADVEFVHYDPQGVLRRRVEARELRLSVDPFEGEALLRFRDGTLEEAGRVRSSPLRFEDLTGRDEYRLRLPVEDTAALEAAWRELLARAGGS